MPDTTVQPVVIAPPPIISLGNDTTLCNGQTLTLNAGNAGDTYQWQDNSSAQTYVVTQGGSYSVRVANGNCIGADTVQITYLNPAVSLGDDTSLCGGRHGIYTSINAFLSGGTYVWGDGSTASTFTATQTGTYTVTVTLSACSATGSVNVTISPPLVVNLGNDTTICNGQIIMLDAGNAGSTYNWSNGSGSQTISVFQTGTYSVTVTNGVCTGTGAVNVTLGNALAVNLGPDTSVCAPNTVVLNPNINGGTYLWQDGSNSSTFTVTQAGEYYVTATLGGCSGTDSIQVSISPAAVVTTTAQPSLDMPQRYGFFMRHRRFCSILLEFR